MFSDFRFALRSLRRNPSFAVVAALSIALGIGANTAMFSLADAMLLRPVPVPRPSEVLNLRSQLRGHGPESMSYADYVDYRAQMRAFSGLTAFRLGTFGFAADRQALPEMKAGLVVSGNFFDVLEVVPQLGRAFRREEDAVPGRDAVIVISHDLWQHDFGATTDVIGKSVRINGKPATIVGIMAPGFAFPLNEQLWVPLYSEFPPTPRNDRRAAGNQVSVLGLIKPGLPLDQASTEFTAIAKRLAASFPDTNKKFDTALVEPLIKTYTPPALQGLLWTMLAFCLGILLIACVNVMNMQFARATLRQKELAIRSSLGATRVRLIRQMLTESLLVAVLGAVVGVSLAFWATDYLQAATHNLANPIPTYITFNVDTPVLVFVVVATMLAAVVSGFVPAWMSSRTNAVEALKESGRGNTSRAVSIITRGLVVFQILVTCVLLIGSLLQLQSILRQQRINYGYDTTALLTARMGLMDGDYPTPEARKLFFDRLVRELRADPEFESAALTNRFRMTFSGFGTIEIEGQSYKTDSDRPNANFEQVTDGYFATLGAKILEGRDFDLDDSDAKLPVAIVNAGFARKHFGNASALGRRFRTVGNNGQLFGPWRTIVGVISNVRMQVPFNIPAVDDTGFYVPYFASIFGPASTAPFPQQFATVVVRPRGHVPPDSVAPALQREVKKVDPNLPLYFVGTPKENQATFLAPNRIIAVMFSVFGAVAVVLASVGLYGVMSFSVNQRTQEFGVRMALGADHDRILQMVLGQGAIQLLIGLVLGLGLSLVIGTVAGGAIAQSAVLFDISPRDPLTYAAVALLLTVVAFIATFVPARKATRVDPMIALRSE